MGASTPIQAVYIVIGVLALLPIYFGSFASLKVPPTHPLSPSWRSLREVRLIA
jgi:minor histocompatibility antigen H13